MKIGFIGQGWIGKNYADTFEERGYQTVRYSLEEPYVNNKEQLKDCEIIFVAVPTPTEPNKGFIDDILINAIQSNTYPEQTVVIKSTIQVGTTNKLQKIFKDRYIMHSPEFLTERTAKYDAMNPSRNIIGYTAKSFSKAGEVMRILPAAPYEKLCPCEEAEFVKYMGNCWFYAKVLMMNIFHDIAIEYNLDMGLMKEMLGADKRVGKTHLDVLHKSGRGAGGHCFIKDFAALRSMYETSKGDNMTESEVQGFNMLLAMEQYNRELLYESNKDLDLLEGVYGKEIFDTKL